MENNRRGVALLGVMIALFMLAILAAVLYLHKGGPGGENAAETYVGAEQRAKDASKLLENAERTREQSMEGIR